MKSIRDTRGAAEVRVGERNCALFCPTPEAERGTHGRRFVIASSRVITYEVLRTFEVLVRNDVAFGVCNYSVYHTHMSSMGFFRETHGIPADDVSCLVERSSGGAKQCYTFEVQVTVVKVVGEARRSSKILLPFHGSSYFICFLTEIDATSIVYIQSWNRRWDVWEGRGLIDTPLLLPLLTGQGRSGRASWLVLN